MQADQGGKRPGGDSGVDHDFVPLMDADLLNIADALGHTEEDGLQIRCPMNREMASKLECHKHQVLRPLGCCDGHELGEAWGRTESVGHPTDLDRHRRSPTCRRRGHGTAPSPIPTSANGAPRALAGAMPGETAR